MTKTQSVVVELKAKGFSDQDIIDGLCDGEALASLGLSDDDQADIEVAVEALRRSIAARALGSAKSAKKAKSSAENGKLGGRPKNSPLRV